VHFEKTRGFFGEDAKSFEVTMRTGERGEANWTISSSETSLKTRVAELLGLGMSVRDIAEETGTSKSKVQRLKAALGFRLDHVPSQASTDGVF
jgi:DNA-binding NarL/FixJ family response regulator